ncbi:MAG TPA: hypothetical protein VGI42_03365 [Chthoniobacterales bacterium]|jgi:hypothetical protein
MNTRFDIQTAAFILGWIGAICWIVCFWWMHRISSRQETMLHDLHEVAKRIESLSKAEHDLIQEVHPNVEKIKKSVQEVAVAVSADDRSGGADR